MLDAALLYATISVLAHLSSSLHKQDSLDKHTLLISLASTTEIKIYISPMRVLKPRITYLVLAVQLLPTSGGALAILTGLGLCSIALNSQSLSVLLHQLHDAV